MRRTLPVLCLLSACHRPTEERATESCEPPTDTSEVVYDGGIVYEIYVRSFRDSDGDGVGDIQGVIEKLDHLEMLNVQTIWLMPIFPSPSPAGYDPEGHAVVRDDYGDEDDLAALLEAASARGMRVTFDVPINHTATSHPWFEAAEADASADERDLYVFSDEQHDTLRWYPADGGGY